MLAFPHVSSRDENPFVRLGSEHFYPLSPRTGPVSTTSGGSYLRTVSARRYGWGDAFPRE